MGTISTISVGVLGCDRIRVWDLFGPLEVLGAARLQLKETTRPCYEIAVVGITSRNFSSEIGLGCKATQLLAGPASFDTVIIPGGTGVRHGDDFRRIVDWLKAHAGGVRRIVSIGTGIYPVAEAGLLNGRRVVTHWRFAHNVATRFPALEVDQTVPFVRHGRFYSCGGGTAPMELALALIEEDFGLQVALPVARDLELRLRPFGDTGKEEPAPPIEYGPSERLEDLPSWMAAHLDEKLSVDELAARACICPRHFRRLFKERFKITPSAFLEQLRLEEARRRLITTRSSIDCISRTVGFNYVNSFRRAFERRFGRSPMSYRKQHTFQSNGRRFPNVDEFVPKILLAGIA